MIGAGTKLGRYEVRSMIGAGGMGEVYLAHDPKIGREVAIKVLPSGVVTDPQRLARFEQEAQAAGSLNHPNILAIYDIDTQDGATFVVSELLKGETFRELMGTEPLQVRKAIAYATQVAHGLAAAHEKGIVHRDIKPENLMITSDGRVKILDFGLAKLTEFDSNGVQTDLPTRQINTDAGSIVGTAGYMSPEQLRGQPVDPRTDIFSFGTVLYEMLSGRKAFQRDSMADTISAILREDPPDLSETNSSVNSGLERVVRRCLEKNREERFHSASDLAFALEALSGVDSSSQIRSQSGIIDAPARERSNLSWLPWAIAGILLITAITLAALYFRRSEPQPSVVRFTLSAPDKMSFGDSLAMSPDGTKIVFTLVADHGEVALGVRSVGGLDVQRLQGTDGAAFPFWSPDSRTIGFFANSKLKRIDAGGGPVQALADASTDPRGGTWSADGTIIFSPGVLDRLYKIPASGGTAVPITEVDTANGETSHRWPSLLPDGIHYLFFVRGSVREKEGVYVGTLGLAERKFIFTSKVAAIYAPPANSQGGRLLVVRDGMLVSQGFDAKKLELIGDPVTIAQDVRSFPTEVGPTGALLVSVSNDGTLAYRTGGNPITQLQWTDRKGKVSDTLGTPGQYHEPMIAPDGKRVVVSRNEGPNQDIWLVDTTRAVMTRFTFEPTVDSSAIFDQTGANIIYSSFRNGKSDLYRKPATGLGAEELVYKGQGNVYPDSVSSDGKYLLVEEDRGAATKFDVLAVPLTGDDRTPIVIAGSSFTETHAQFSPDGRWVSYSSDESGRGEVYVRSFGTAGGQWQISTNGGDQALWNPKGKEVFYIGFDRYLNSVPYESGASFVPGRPEPLFASHVPITGLADERNNYIVTPDGQRFLMVNLVDESLNSPIVMVVNWLAESR
jgi:serine/threonine protein kinase/Tol biopolymer transport system component